MPCDLNAACTNVVGSYKCECLEGYIGDGMSCQKEAVDECTLGQHNCEQICIGEYIYVSLFTLFVSTPSSRIPVSFSKV